MKYQDSYKNIRLYKMTFLFERRKLKKNLDKLIKHEEENVDFLRNTINSFEEQKKKWENDNAEGFSEAINTYSLMLRALELGGRLSTICLDVYTSMKFLVNSHSEYDCRFFARRIFTILYETRKGYIADLGKLLGDIKILPYIQYYDSYKEYHKRLNKFINEYEEISKKVRNTNEAHKFENFATQVESIEHVEIEKAILIINEYYNLLSNISYPNMLLLQELSNHVSQELMNKMNKANEELGKY